MDVPGGYLDRLTTAVVELAGEWLVFVESATPEEVKAAEASIARIAARENGEARDHDVHNVIAKWTIENIDRIDPNRPDSIDEKGLWADILALLEDIVFHHGVDPAGTIYGFERFENLDPDWLQYLVGWLQHAPSYDNLTAPGQAGTVVNIADQARLAVVGDWGTGTDFSTQTAGPVAAAMGATDPDYSIHLGDVYYRGTSEQQTTNFVGPWKQAAAGRLGSFTLNSNHDMYSGAAGYVKTTLADPAFCAQGGQGHFALINSNWAVVGLDTAFHSSWDDQFMFGDLAQGQLDFLTEHASADRGLILLTHHQGLREKDGKPNQPLHDKVVDAVGRSGRGEAPWYWYWGHIHAGYVHRDGASGAPYRGRCNGHGSIPWGYARELESNSTVEWFETTPNPIGSHRVMNGFALLTLDGAGLTEAFYDQSGTVTWSRTHTA